MNIAIGRPPDCLVSSSTAHPTFDDLVNRDPSRKTGLEQPAGVPGGTGEETP